MHKLSIRFSTWQGFVSKICSEPAKSWPKFYIRFTAIQIGFNQLNRENLVRGVRVGICACGYLESPFEPT